VQTLKGKAIPGWNQWLGALLLLMAIFMVAMQPAARRVWKTIKRKFCCLPENEEAEEDLNPPQKKVKHGKQDDVEKGRGRS